jgi:hypothetical protein
MKHYTVGRYRLLIFDSHGSHVTPKFDYYCHKNAIIVLCISAHSSHLLQLLDVGCFSPLKRFYRQEVEQLMSVDISHIDKQEFLQLYQRVRPKALHSTNIQSSFTATGLIRYNPNRVLRLLNAPLRTPSPCRPPTASSWKAETPHNIIELQYQTELIKQYLKRRSRSPPSPTDRALNQLVKGCKIAMYSAILLASQNEHLLAENQYQKRKQEKKLLYIAKGGVLSGTEALSLMEKDDSSQNNGSADVQQKTQQRAPPKCSLCSSLEHNAHTCSEC